MKWNKLTTRVLTNEEKELYSDYDFMWDSQTPDIGEQVLVYANGRINIDTWDDFGPYGVGFENIDEDVIYWMALPEPPKEELKNE
ncbi:hypothetical protein ACVRZG_02755 [Streptococcus hyovaginalis]|uniref:phage protein n=1 Tax=Streptococcus hyovaginalis TaxID=149015 RepID=UPI00041E9867|nr:phage protein [Streptococcus hyovaginalis]QBX25440.1 hypothetical protein Javan258_0033 [Streptococcus phage Javan258]